MRRREADLLRPAAQQIVSIARTNVPAATLSPVAAWIAATAAPSGGVGPASVEDQLEALRRRLRAMERDAQLIYTRRGTYAPVDKLDLILGRIAGHRDGFGFLIPDAGGDDIFLPPRQMRSLMNGDRVLVRVVGRDFKGRPEGTVAEVIERVSRSVVGRLHVDQGVSYVIPENPRVQQATPHGVLPRPETPRHGLVDDAMDAPGRVFNRKVEFSGQSPDCAAALANEYQGSAAEGRASRSWRATATGSAASTSPSPSATAWRHWCGGAG